jgi:hypothetical protein
VYTRRRKTKEKHNTICVGHVCTIIRKQTPERDMALETPEDDELLLSDQIPPRDFQLPSPQLHQVNNYTIKLYRNVVFL